MIQQAWKKVDFVIYILCIVLAATICIFLYADGVLRDEYNESINSIRLWQNLCAVLLYGVLFIGLRDLWRFNVIKALLVALFVPILIFSVITTTGSTSKFIRIVKDNQYQNTGFNEISLDYLEEVIVQEKTALLYIDREDCPACNNIFPKLETYVYGNQMNFLYYTTIDDCNDQSEKLREILDVLGVHSIPVVLDIKNGKVAEAFFVEDIVTAFMSKNVNQ